MPHGLISPQSQVYLFDLTYKQRPYTFLLPRKCHSVGKFCLREPCCGGWRLVYFPLWRSPLFTLTCVYTLKKRILHWPYQKGSHTVRDLSKALHPALTGLLVPGSKNLSSCLFPSHPGSWISSCGLQLVYPRLHPSFPSCQTERNYILCSQQRAHRLFFIPLPACPDLFSGTGSDLGK